MSDAETLLPDTTPDAVVVEKVVDPSDAAEVKADPKTDPVPPQTADGGDEWHWMDGIVGAGDRPDWLDAKYNSVAEQAKAHTELEKKFGAFTGAPDEYTLPTAESFADKIELPEGVDFNIDSEDPMLKAFGEFAKAKAMDQDTYNEIIGIYIQGQATDFAASQTTAAEEKKALGSDVEARLKSVAEWGHANLDPELFKDLQGTLMTAGSVRLIENLISKTRNAILPKPGDGVAVPGITKADIDELFQEKTADGKRRYIVDENFRKRVLAKLTQLKGSGHTNTVVS